MISKMRRNFAGVFTAQPLSRSLWRLMHTPPAPAEIYVRGAEPGAEQLLGGQGLHNVGIEWHDGRTLLTFSRGGYVESLTAAAILVHEPAPDVLRALPLAPYDARARRFWRRVFWIVRLPGGRAILQVLARRAR